MGRCGNSVWQSPALSDWGLARVGQLVPRGAAIGPALESQTPAVTMTEFRVRVSTGEAFGAGTWDKVSVSIVGTRGETPPLPLDSLGKEFTAGAVSVVAGSGGGRRREREGRTLVSDTDHHPPPPQEEDFKVTAPQDVGPVLLLRVHKAPLDLLRPLVSDAWFCRWLQLTPPQGAPLRFPCYQWLEGAGTLVLQEGTGEEETGGRRGCQ